MCSNSECTYRWSQLRAAPGGNLDIRPARRPGGYTCRHCHHDKRDPFRSGHSFAHVCYADNTGFNKVVKRMIGGNPGYQETGCRAVYLSKRLAALQRVFRASLYAIRLMPRRKRLLTGLKALGALNPDIRRYIMEMAGLARSRTTPPKQYTLWTAFKSPPRPLGILVLEGYQPGDNLDAVAEQVLNIISQSLPA